MNLFEGLPGFLAATTTSVFCKIPFAIRFHMAALFLVFRVGYFAAYLSGLHWVRTYLFMCGVSCCIVLFGWSILPGFDTWFVALGTMLSGKFR